MSPCWVEFRQSEVPNTWNPRLVGTQFRPKRKPRYFGSVPTIRCVGSKRGLKCLRRNSLNKRWYSVSPARTCARMFPRRGPASARAILEVRGQRAQLNPQRILNAEDAVPGMKIPLDYETHILDHMRCNCSACMNFACQWRRALKDEFRQCVKDPLAPKRKPKRWMPLLERQRPSERAPFTGRPDKRLNCRRSPRVSWWYGNYSPSSDSDEYLPKPEAFDVEQRQTDKFKHLLHSQQHASESNANGFEDVAMDGTKLPSRLTYRGTRDASSCRDSTVGRSSRAAASFIRPQSTRRNRLAQGILSSEDVSAGSQIDELENKSTHRSSPKKYDNLPDNNWDKDSIYESQDDNEHFVNCRDEYLKLSEPDKCQSFKSRNLMSDKSTNKFSPYRNNLRSSRSSNRAVDDDKVNNYYDATRRNQYRPQFSERSGTHYGRGYHYLKHSKEPCGGLSFPERHISKYMGNNDGKTRDHYQQYNKTHQRRYLLDVDPIFEANPTCQGSLSRSLSYLDDSLDSCNNRRASPYGMQHRSPTGQQYLHQRRHYPSHHHHYSHFHDDNVWNSSHHTSQPPLEMSRQLPRNNRDYPNCTEVGQEIHSNKNIYNRSVDGATGDTRTTHGGNVRRKINFHTAKSEKINHLDSDDSNESSVQSRSPSKLYKRWTSLSPSKFDLHPSKKQHVSARELNDNDNKSINSERERLREPEKREDGKRCSQASSASRRKQKVLNTKTSLLPAESPQENENNTYKRQRTFSLSPLDSARLKTLGRSRRSRSRSRKMEDSKAKLTETERNVLDTTQSNTSYSASSPTKHRRDKGKHTFGPSERVMREPRPKSRPEWLNKHMRLMTECSQEQQNNAKSRMTRIVQKTNELSRSTEHAKLDLNQLNERLDRVKDLQQSYFERAEEAIQRMKARNRDCYKSQLAKDNSQNATENHRRVPSTFRDATPDQRTRRRRKDDSKGIRTRTKQVMSPTERQRLYRQREDGSVERHCRDRFANSEDSSDIGLDDTLPTTDSGSKQDSQIDDGVGSWFIDDKRRLIARKNALTMKHKNKTNW